jgi:hypothetical protein
MGYKDPGQEQHPGNADEREEDSECFFCPRLIERSDGVEIDQQAEAETEGKTHSFDHIANCIQCPGVCQVFIAGQGNEAYFAAHGRNQRLRQMATMPIL